MYSPKRNRSAQRTFLTTGYKSGLGRFLFENFGGTDLDRNISSQKFEKISRDGADVIIHCAAQGPKSINSSSLYSYINDNVLLTKRVAEIRCKKFIFISSVDVYPKTKASHNENEDIPIEGATNLYATTKLMSESIIREMCPNFLILRCSALLGAYSRSNSLIKIAEEESPAVTLSDSSVVNYVRHKQIADFIELAINENLSGIYNALASENITVGSVAKLLGKKVRFGRYDYFVGDISNRKISKVSSSFKKSSEEVIREFTEEDLPKRKYSKAPIL